MVLYPVHQELVCEEWPFGLCWYCGLGQHLEVGVRQKKAEVSCNVEYVSDITLVLHW